VHLADWPSYSEDLIDDQLSSEMVKARSLSERIHAVRKENNIKVRQPLGSVWLSALKSKKEFSPSIEDLIKDEVNIKHIEYEAGNKLAEKKNLVEFSDGAYIDLTITQDLKDEGEARDLMRKIQEERKKLGTSLDEKVDVTRPDWPEEFESEIKRKALINNLSKGEFKVSKI
jgi:isoleucyl-tRNA synthetase